eukprot:249731-Chlamydomonas_euryale.AAC.1
MVGLEVCGEEHVVVRLQEAHSEAASGVREHGGIMRACSMEQFTDAHSNGWMDGWTGCMLLSTKSENVCGRQRAYRRINVCGRQGAYSRINVCGRQ